MMYDVGDIVCYARVVQDELDKRKLKTTLARVIKGEPMPDPIYEGYKLFYLDSNNGFIPCEDRVAGSSIICKLSDLRPCFDAIIEAHKTILINGYAVHEGLNEIDRRLESEI